LALNEVQKYFVNDLTRAFATVSDRGFYFPSYGTAIVIERAERNKGFRKSKLKN
jgi:hypothetical protein